MVCLSSVRELGGVLECVCVCVRESSCVFLYVCVCVCVCVFVQRYSCAKRNDLSFALSVTAVVLSEMFQRKGDDLTHTHTLRHAKTSEERQRKN